MKVAGSIYTYSGIQGAQGNSGDGGPATSAQTSRPCGLAIDGFTGNLYIAYLYNRAVRMVAQSTGIITTVAGTGAIGYSGDGGPATLATMSVPFDVAIDPFNGNIYIADAGIHVIRMVKKSTGIISTVAGTGKKGYTGNGKLAVNATLSTPVAIVVDPNTGNLYISDRDNHVIRMVSKATGVITTIIGTGRWGYTGDGGRAINATLDTPGGIAIATKTGNIYIADTQNNVIRMMTRSTGILSTVAGTTQSSSGGVISSGVPATTIKLDQPGGVAIDALNGDIFIADSRNNVIRMVNGSGIITTIAGNRYGRNGFSGDGGPATDALLSYPTFLAVDTNTGTMYIADSFNYVVRNVIGAGTATPMPTAAPVEIPTFSPTILGELTCDVM
jgi:hypothetical protein